MVMDVRVKRRARRRSHNGSAYQVMAFKGCKTKDIPTQDVRGRFQATTWKR